MVSVSQALPQPRAFPEGPWTPAGSTVPSALCGAEPANPCGATFISSPGELRTKGPSLRLGLSWLEHCTVHSRVTEIKFPVGWVWKATNRPSSIPLPSSFFDSMRTCPWARIKGKRGENVLKKALWRVWCRMRRFTT